MFTWLANNQLSCWCFQIAAQKPMLFAQLPFNILRKPLQATLTEKQTCLTQCHRFSIAGNSKRIGFHYQGVEQRQSPVPISITLYDSKRFNVG